MGRIFRDSDFILAGFIFCVSSILCVYAYAKVREIEQPNQSIASDIREGTQTFRIVADGHCPGEFTTTLAHAGVWGIKSSGTLKTSYGKMLTDIQIAADALFNPLGQLNSAKITLSSDGYGAVIELSNPHPITVSFHTTGNGAQIHENFEIPGPIMLGRTPNGHYRIEYAYIPIMQSPSVKALQGFMSRELNLSVVEEDDAPSSCSSEDGERLNLLPLAIRSRSMLQPILALASAAMNREKP